jgi:hypothetical protein
MPTHFLGQTRCIGGRSSPDGLFAPRSRTIECLRRRRTLGAGGRVLCGLKGLAKAAIKESVKYGVRADDHLMKDSQRWRPAAPIWCVPRREHDETPQDAINYQRRHQFGVQVPVGDSAEAIDRWSSGFVEVGRLTLASRRLVDRPCPRTARKGSRGECRQALRGGGLRAASCERVSGSLVCV